MDFTGEIQVAAADVVACNHKLALYVRIKMSELHKVKDKNDYERVSLSFPSSSINFNMAPSLRQSSNGKPPACAYSVEYAEKTAPKNITHQLLLVPYIQRKRKSIYLRIQSFLN